MSFPEAFKELVSFIWVSSTPQLKEIRLQTASRQHFSEICLSCKRWITGSLRLEKTSKITKSMPNPFPPCPLPTSLSATSPQFWNTSRDGDSTTSLFQCLITLSEIFFLISSLKHLQQCAWSSPIYSKNYWGVPSPTGQIWRPQRFFWSYSRFILDKATSSVKF